MLLPFRSAWSHCVCPGYSQHSVSGEAADIHHHTGDSDGDSSGVWRTHHPCATVPQDKVKQDLLLMFYFFIFSTVLLFIILSLFFFLSPSVGVEDDSGGLVEDGREIPYNRNEGNWFISKFSKLDKK